MGRFTQMTLEEIEAAVERRYKAGFNAGKQEAIREIEKLSLDILEEHFPKLNGNNPSKPSGNGRGEVMMYRGFLLALLNPSTSTKQHNRYCHYIATGKCTMSCPQKQERECCRICAEYCGRYGVEGSSCKCHRHVLEPKEWPCKTCHHRPRPLVGTGIECGCECHKSGATVNTQSL